ncbi:hypothetical protein BV20DRAFT_974443 [Pilatotrama ljubarskyi]|nr:hypothetical protein BV20DRAFT_974443 [Pilatotrama ljubarskyi]
MVVCWSFRGRPSHKHGPNGLPTQMRGPQGQRGVRSADLVPISQRGLLNCSSVKSAEFLVGYVADERPLIIYVELSLWVESHIKTNEAGRACASISCHPMVIPRSQRVLPSGHNGATTPLTRVDEPSAACSRFGLLGKDASKRRVPHLWKKAARTRRQCGKDSWADSLEPRVVVTRCVPQRPPLEHVARKVT